MINIDNFTAEELKELARRMKEKENAERNENRAAYESLKADLLYRIRERLDGVIATTENFREWLGGETTAFYDVMKEYGALQKKGQESFSISNDGFKVCVDMKKSKDFDERADIAAEKLIAYLKDWISARGGDTDNPMYTLAMMLLERNKQGDLDYASISKLYDMESKFNDPVYSEIMNMFKESNVVATSKKYYSFFTKGEYGWKREEPSFNRM